MSRKPHEWVCDIAPGCHFKAGIKIYSDAKALRAAIGCRQTFIEGNLHAFCRCEGGGSNDRLVTLNFCWENMTPEIVAHEVFHAVAELLRVTRLNLENEYAQEIAAHAVTHLMLRVKEAAKLSKPPTKRRRQNCDLSRAEKAQPGPEIVE